MRFFQILAAVTILSLVAGCHSSKNAESNSANSASDQPAQSSSTIADPCKLLTQQEASAAAGEQMGPGKLAKLATGPRCGFHAKNYDEVFLDVVDPALFDSFAHLDTTPVQGIGDQALWQHNKYATFLYIKKGGNVVSLGLPRSIASLTPEIEKAGKAIAGRM